jgi:hypothetical protein
MRLKIQGGTADNGQPALCLTCRHATIVKGRSLSDEIIECGRLSDGTQITFAVTSCTAYADRRRAALHEMEEIAWVLRSDPKKNTVGFVKASELRRLVVADDWD